DPFPVTRNPLDQRNSVVADRFELGRTDPLPDELHRVGIPQTRLVKELDSTFASVATSDGAATLAPVRAGVLGTQFDARPRYRPSRVSTLTVSPVSRNSGTCNSAPVCNVADFVPPVERSPCTPGPVSSIVSSIFVGSSTYNVCPSCTPTCTSELGRASCRES